MILLNEARLIKGLSYNLDEATIEQADRVYKILCITQAYAKSYLAGAMCHSGYYHYLFNFPRVSSADDFEEILDALNLWYRKVYEKVKQGKTGNFLFSLPFSFDFLTYESEIAMKISAEDKPYELITEINKIGSTIKEIITSLPDEYRIRTAKLNNDINSDEFPEDSFVVKKSGNDLYVEIFFPVAPYLGIKSGGVIPDEISGKKVKKGNLEVKTINGFLNKNDVTKKESDILFMFLLYSCAVRKNTNTINALAGWYNRVLDNVSQGKSGNFISTVPLFKGDLPFNKTLLKIKKKLENEHLVFEMGIKDSARKIFIGEDDLPIGTRTKKYIDYMSRSTPVKKIYIERAGILNRLGIKDGEFVKTDFHRNVADYLFGSRFQCSDDMKVDIAKLEILMKHRVPLVDAKVSMSTRYLFLLKKDYEVFRKYIELPNEEVIGIEGIGKEIADYERAVRKIAKINEERSSFVYDDDWVEIDR